MRERTIIFATDLLGDTANGVALATQLARRHAATLVFLHVIPLRTADGEAMLYSGIALGDRQVRARLYGLTPDDPSVPYRHLLRVGEPCTQITAAIEAEGAELLVVSARKRSLLRRVFGTGLLERLQLQASCPVVTYREARTSEPLRPRVHLGRRKAAPDVLSALLEARIQALQGWLTLQREATRALARRPNIQHSIESLVRGHRWDLDPTLMRQIRSELALELGEHRRALGAIGVAVRSPFDGAPLLEIGAQPEIDTAHQRWLDQLLQREAGVSLPLLSADGCVLQTGACVAIADAPPALLLFTLDARRDFLRILAQPGPTPSSETYAFDHEGLMLSYSRFPDQLRQIGLLPAEPGAQTPRRLHVCDPGGNLLCGEGRLDPMRPLTRMAAAATAGEDGCDWSGYRDYRGVPVVGAWRWLPEYGFGVAAEMDAVALRR